MSEFSSGASAVGESAIAPRAAREPGRAAGVRARETSTTARHQPPEATPTPDLIRFERRAGRHWGALVHESRWFPLPEQALDSFTDTTRRHGSGDVRPVARGVRAVVTDRRGGEPPSDPGPGAGQHRLLPDKIAAT
ncbi:hypothetical protein ABTZ99_24645 [Actinosynnema sp. NPDC002837]